MNERLDEATDNEPPRLPDPIGPLALDARERLARAVTLAAEYTVADQQMRRMDREDLDELVDKSVGRLLGHRIAQELHHGETIRRSERQLFPDQVTYDTTFAVECVLMTRRDYEVLCELIRRVLQRKELL